ncbi:MAG: alpha/beta hydrolase [Anaerolineae bacterium]|nr:alpha/beta hydrolase [Anaerolineae bacterium]
MFVVTNRSINENAEGLEKLGSIPNPKGPNELRLVEATKEAGDWQINIVPDTLNEKMKSEVGITGPETAYGSQYVARKVFERVGKGQRNFLFFVHGFNNDFKAVLDRADNFAQNFNVEVAAFSWPANGGGVKGVADYLSDKRDAAASVGALDRCFGKIYDYLNGFNEERLEKIFKEAQQRYPKNAESRDKFVTKMAEQGCPFTVNLVLHSMGNYLFKKVLESSIFRGTKLIFDNVLLVAADTNSQNHAEWVDQIHCRKRVYITINEDDAALMASRMKAGEGQLARLGHYPYNLNSQQAVYVDFTNAAYVGNSHAYFEGQPLRNKAVRQFFDKAFNGQRAEEDLRFDPATGTYRPRR